MLAGLARQQRPGHWQAGSIHSAPCALQHSLRRPGLLLWRRASTLLQAPSLLQVLRLEPHVVVSNRTSVPLQLLQSRLDFVAPHAAAGGARPCGPVVAEGGSSFSQGSRSMNSALLTGGGEGGPL